MRPKKEQKNFKDSSDNLSSILFPVRLMALLFEQFTTAQKQFFLEWFSPFATFRTLILFDLKRFAMLHFTRTEQNL